MNVPENEYNPYFQSYIELATKGVSIVDSLEKNLVSVADFYKSIPLEKQEYAYTEGKWTPKDILLHLIDAERVFAYRALRIARFDTTDMSGFEQDHYVASGKANNRTMEDLIEEYKTVRQSSISLFKSLNDENLKAMGKASGSAVSVRALGHFITGHENHHNKIIKERYL